MKPVRATIIQSDADPVDRIVLAVSIREISRGMTKLLSQGLNERAIMCLVHDYSGIGKTDIRGVLQALKFLEKEYCQ